MPARASTEGANPTRNSAATIPNNAMNAGRSTDCDIAAENGSRTNSGSCKRNSAIPRVLTRRVGRHLGADPPRHERGHGGAAEHRPELADRVEDGRAGAGQMRRQVAGRGGRQRRPHKRHPDTNRGERQHQPPDRRVRGHLERKPRQRDRQHRKAETEHGPRMVSVDDPADKRREHPVGDRHRRDQQGRARRRQPTHRLRIERQRQHHRRRGERDDGHPDVAQAEVPVGEHVQRDQRLAGVHRLPVDERRNESRARDDRRPDPRLPSGGLALLQPEHDQEHAHPGQPDADQIEPVRLGRQHRNQPHRQRQPDDADRDIDEEDPLPTQPVHQHAAGQRTHQAGHAGGSTPHAHRDPAPLRREDPGDRRQGLRGEHPGADPCTTRAAISMAALPDSPHHTEATVNTTRPIR